jgi:hypothetical protein
VVVRRAGQWLDLPSQVQEINSVWLELGWWYYKSKDRTCQSKQDVCLEQKKWGSERKGSARGECMGELTGTASSICLADPSPTQRQTHELKNI